MMRDKSAPLVIASKGPLAGQPAEQVLPVQEFAALLVAWVVLAAPGLWAARPAQGLAVRLEPWVSPALAVLPQQLLRACQSM